MEFILVLIILPIAVALFSIIGVMISKKWFVQPIFTFVLSIIAMLVFLNSSFFIWVLIYTLMSLVINSVMNLINIIDTKEKIQ